MMSMQYAYVRRGFTALELLLTVSILISVLAFAIPTYREYQVRNDLLTATDQVSQALGRAQLRAQAGEQGKAWGYSVSERTLFGGDSFATRDPFYDEIYPIPQTIGTSGLNEVTFTRLTGIASATGTIVLTSLLGEERDVHILIDRQGIAVNIDDKLVICHCQGAAPNTINISESAWPTHRAHGDYLGACHTPDPSDSCNLQ